MSSLEEYELKGSYEIERYLYGELGLQAGGWVAGQTVFGSIEVGGASTECFTRPAYAYLSYCSRVQENHSDEYISRQRYCCGLAPDFIGDLGVSFSVNEGINRVNALSGIVTELPAKAVWGMPCEYARDIYLSGSQAFLIYQVNIAYAHCRDTGGQDSLALCAAFEQVNGQQVLVSSIATHNVVAVAESQTVDVAGWLSIKQAVLERLRQGALQFDRSVKDVPFYRYK